MFGLAGLTTKVVGIGAAIAIAVVVTICGVVVLGKNGEIKSLTDLIHNPKTGYIQKLKVAEDTANARQITIDGLNNTIRTQNASYEALEAKSKAQDKQADAMLAAVRSSNRGLTNQIERLRAQQSTGNMCKDTENLFNSIGLGVVQ